MKGLKMLDAWKNGVSNFFAPNSAQGYLGKAMPAMAVSGSCGSSCGAGEEKEKPKPSACGSSCGAGDEKEAPKPSACGAGDDKKPEKPSSCGAGC